MGDTADGYAGVKGIDEKKNRRSYKVIQQYQSV